MLAIIAVAAIKAITCYLTTSYMKAHFGSIDIEGAPFWYGRESSEEICVSDATKGGLIEIDREKNRVKIKLQNKLSDIVSYAIHTNKQFSHLKPDEEKFLNSIIKDKKLKWFVDKNGYYKNIKTDENKNMIFIRMCVTKNAFIQYEKNRIKNLQKEISMYKAGKEFDELEGKRNNFNDPEDNAFRELNKNF